MEDILNKLLIPDNKIILEATLELKQALKSPDAIPTICDIIVSSQNPQIRQSAAVLLRRKLSKKRHWSKLNNDIRGRIKAGMLQALVNEQEQSVKNSIAQFIGLIGKYEFPDNTWPEVLQFIQSMSGSTNVLDRELAMYTLSIMTEISQGSYIVHAESLGTLFNSTMLSLSQLDSGLAYYTVMTMQHLVPIISGHQHMINIYHTLLPRILEIIKAHVPAYEKRSCDMLGILEELIESAVAVIVPHVRIIVEMCLAMAKEPTNIGQSIKVKAVSVVGWLVRSKGKVVLKNKLVEPIVDVLIELMGQKPEDGCDINADDDVYFSADSDTSTTTTIATQTLDLVALHIPSDKVVPYLLARVEPAIQGDDLHAQKAAYLALAVLAEGCSERIRQKYLEAFLKCVCNAIHNCNATIVRNAAFFALGQFAEHLQPEISQYASDLLPVLFEYMNQVYAQMEKENVVPPSLDRLFYAVETFCENLDDGLLPYLPTLMDRLFVALDPNGWSEHLRRIALSTLASVASAAKSGMLPYFQQIIQILNVYINSTPDSPLNELQADAIETLAVVAQYIGEEHFKPLASESLQLGMRILESTEDPDIKRSVYALFASLAIVIKEDLAPVLPKIIQPMIDSIRSSEGIVSHHEEDEKRDVDVYGDLESDEDQENDIDLEVESTATDDSDGSRYLVENAYTEEKEQACLSLSEICEHTGSAFIPFYEQCFEEIFKMVNYPQDDIRRVSIGALLQFCVSLHAIQTYETKQMLYGMLQKLVPKCSELIRCDEERGVVTSCLDAFAKLLEEIKGEVLVGDGHREAIMNCVVDVLTFQTMCQDTDLDRSEQMEDETEAEQDELLLESACDVIPKFGAAITPEDFATYFPNLLQLIEPRTKKMSSISQRSFAFGTLAECMKPIGVQMMPYVRTLLQLWINGAGDSAEEVRNNAIFGIGEMVLYGKEGIFPHYPHILSVLSNAVSKESNSGVLDNICGALAKMILANVRGIPLEQVFPVFIQHLPLRQDFQENDAVIKCLFALYKQGNDVLRIYLTQVMKIVIQVYHKKQLENDEIRSIAVDFLKSMNRDFSDEFSNAAASMTPEVTSELQRILA